jgi:hypothetical protein
MVVLATTIHDCANAMPCRRKKLMDGPLTNADIRQRAMTV